MWRWGREGDAEHPPPRFDKCGRAHLPGCCWVRGLPFHWLMPTLLWLNAPPTQHKDVALLKSMQRAVLK